MNRLARDVAFCVKNYNKTRTILSCVQLKPLKNSSRSFALWKKCAVQSMFYQNTSHSTVVTTQAPRFSSDATTISQIDYEHFCVETLDSLCDYIEELVESVDHLSTADVLNKVNKANWT